MKPYTKRVHSTVEQAVINTFPEVFAIFSKHIGHEQAVIATEAIAWHSFAFDGEPQEVATASVNALTSSTECPAANDFLLNTEHRKEVIAALTKHLKQYDR